MIDLHNDALLKLPPQKLLPYLRRAKAAGVDEIWLSVWTTELKDPLAVITKKQTILNQIAGDPEYPLCRLHIEDAWFATPDNIDKLIVLHPHSVGLTWNAANNLAGGAHSKSGITPWGYQVIKRLEAAGIQIDTAHLAICPHNHPSLSLYPHRFSRRLPPSTQFNQSSNPRHQQIWWHGWFSLSS